MTIEFLNFQFSFLNYFSILISHFSLFEKWQIKNKCELVNGKCEIAGAWL